MDLPTMPQTMASTKIGIVISTYQSARHLPFCLPPLLNSPLKAKVLVADASSQDGTAELAAQMGAEVWVFPKKEYNHGLTREAARKRLKTDFVVMMTPDAYAVDEGVIGKLVAPLMEKRAEVAYARQLPHEGASFFEAFPRLFNYPEESQIRSLTDYARLGSYTFFCSNSCAAYSQQALDAVGGFPAVLLGEDTYAAAKILRAGGRIAYVAEAKVRHSHNYSLIKEFQHYFDTGLARSSYSELLGGLKNDGRRGSSFFRYFMLHLAKHQPWLIPYGCLHTLSKWCGYRIGKLAVHAPDALKRILSSQKFYWDSTYYLNSVTRPFRSGIIQEIPNQDGLVTTNKE